MSHWGRLLRWGVAAVVLAGCTDLWRGTARPELQNCVSNPAACASDQTCNTQTEVCETVAPVDLSSPDQSSLLLAPISLIFPGGLISSLDFPRDAQYSLEAPLNATIYYTLDGTVPTPGALTSSFGQSPIKLGAVPAGTVIRWYADYGAGYLIEAPHLFTALTTNPAPIDLGMIPEPVTFNQSGSSIVTVSPGSQLVGKLHFQAWQSTSAGECPSCTIQFVVSVEGVGAIGCLSTLNTFGVYPGQSALLNLMGKAPMNPGRYKVYAGLARSSACDGSTPAGPEVGEVIVK